MSLEPSFHWLHQCRGGSNMGALLLWEESQAWGFWNFIKIKWGISCPESLMPSHVEVWSAMMCGGSGPRLGLSCDQTESPSGWTRVVLVMVGLTRILRGKPLILPLPPWGPGTVGFTASTAKPVSPTFKETVNMAYMNAQIANDC